MSMTARRIPRHFRGPSHWKKALLPTEWVKIASEGHETPCFLGFSPSLRGEKSGMMRGCENNVGWMMRIGLPVSVRTPRSVASSAIPSRASCGSCAGEKNGLWIVWTVAANLLRPQDSSSARPLLWRHPGVPGDRDPARALPELRRREAREAALVGQQPLLHQAVCLLRRPSLSVRDGPRCGTRTAPRLEDGQVAGNGLHA